MRVTVVVPTYNRAGYLATTLESIVAQTREAAEIIVVDNASTDSTRAVVAGFDGAVRYVHCPTRGEAHAVNAGLRRATGDLIGVVSDDDPVAPAWLERMVEPFQRSPAILCAYPDWTMIDPDGRPMQQIQVHDFNYRNMIAWHYCMPGPGTLFRRRALDLVGGRDPRWPTTGDFDFYLRLGLHGDFVHVPQPLASWRHHPGAATIAKKGGAMAWERVRMIRHHFARHGRSADIRGLRRQAMASAYFAAGFIAEQIWLRRYFFAGYLLHEPGYLRRLPPNFAGLAAPVREVLALRRRPSPRMPA